MTHRIGVLQGMQEMDTGSSGNIGWEGEEQELGSVQRQLQCARSCLLGKLAQRSMGFRSRGQMSRSGVVVHLLHAG